MKFFNDTLLLLRRHVRKTMRIPIWLFIGLSQPILYLLLYLPLLKNVAGGPALPTSEVVRVFVPGMLIIMGMGSLFAGFGFIPEIRQGVIARWLVTPVSRVSIILSMVLNQMVTLVLQSTILIFIALLFGLKITFVGGVLTLLLVAFMGMAMASLSYTISMSVRDESGLATVTNTFFLPILLLSGIMLPMSLAPHWLRIVAHFNPVYYVVEAARALFAGNFGDAIVFQGFAIALGLVVTMFFFSVRALRKMAA